MFYFSFLLVSKDTITRIVIQIIACSFFYGIGGISLLTNKKKYKFSFLIGIAILMYAVFQLVRAFILYHVAQPYNFLNGSVIDN